MDMHAHSHEGSPLGFTGERVLPDIPEWAWCFQAHKFGYDDLLERVREGARMLDIGCGEGYGAAQLSRKTRVVATDYSSEAVQHARAKYGTRIRWVVCDAQRLPFRDAAFDVAASLQVIEHFRDTDSHLAGVARALTDEGWYYVATPNIDLMGPEEKDNEFHLRDFTPPELQDALAHRFGDVEMLGMFYKEDSIRYQTMIDAETRERDMGPTIERMERVLAKVPGPLRVRIRRLWRTWIGAPSVSSSDARNAIVASDFEARAPAEESFCLIGIARRPRR